MPLIAANLARDFSTVRETFPPNPNIMARAYADAIVAFWGAAIGPLGGKVIAAPALPILSSGLIAVFGAYYASSQAVASDVAKTIDAGLKALKIVGPADGANTGPISGQQSGTLQSGLFSLWSRREAPIRSITTQEAFLILDFTTSGIATTTGIPVPMIPGIGPIT